MITQRKLTVDAVLELSRLGHIAPDERVELLEGELYSMTPPSSKHAGTVKRLAKDLERLYGHRVLVSVQDPVVLSEGSLLEPDLALLKPRDDFYTESHPGPADILLIVEVSLSSLLFDRERKLPLYAKAGLPEVWIMNLDEDRLEVYREPAGAHYRLRLLLQPGEKVVPLALPDAQELAPL